MRGIKNKWIKWMNEKEIKDSIKKRGKKITQTDLDKYGLKVKGPSIKLTKAQEEQLKKMRERRKRLEKRADELTKRIRGYNNQIDALREIAKTKKLPEQERNMLKTAENEKKRALKELVKTIKDAF